MRAPFVILVPMIAACSSSADVSQATPKILVVGSDMGVLFQNINLSRGNAAVSGALVSVNGTIIPETQTGHYAGQLPGALPAGASIQLVVVAGSDTITATTTVPTAPTLQTPTSGATIHIPVPLDFTWTDAGNPDAFVAGIQYNGTAEIASFGPAERAGIVVTSRIPASATNLSAYVFAYAEGTFTGPSESGSRMHVRQSSQIVPLNLGP